MRLRAAALLAQVKSSRQINVGDQVAVDGFQMRGIVTKRNGRRLTISFKRSEIVIERDQMFVHPISGRTL